MSTTTGSAFALTLLCAGASATWGQGVDIQTYNDSSASTSRMQFQQGVASPAAITVLNARLGFNGSTGYFNIASSAAASPSGGDLRYDGTNALLYTSTWRALAFTETGAAAFTSGSVLFAGSNGLLQQDNASLFFNDSTNRLGIGDATPDTTLDIESTETALSAYSTTSSANAFLFTANSVDNEDVMSISATGLTIGRALAVTATAAPTGGSDVQGINVELTSSAGDNNSNEVSAIRAYVTDSSTRPTDNIAVKGEVSDTGTPAADFKEVFGGWFRGSKTASAGYGFGTESYGVYAEGIGDTDGANTMAFGIYAEASGADQNFGGFFATEDNATSTVLRPVGLYRETTGTPANNIGTGLLFMVEGNAASGTEPEDVAQLSGILTNATHGSEAGALAILTRTGGGSLTERLRVDAVGTVTPGASLQDLGSASLRWDFFGAAGDFSSGATTGAAVQITASSLTSGDALSLAGPSGDITTFTGNVIYGSAALGGTGANLIYLDGSVEATSGTVDASWFRVNQTGNSGSNTLRSVFSQLTDSTNFANTNVGLLADVSKTGATSSGTVNTYGIWADTDASTTDSGSTATFNTYAVRADAFGDTDGTSTAYGLYASASGADTNWAGYFSGNVGVASPATTGIGVQITGSSLTSGDALSLAGPSGGVTTFTGNLIYGSADLGGTGANLIYLDGSVEATSGTVDASWFRVNQTGNSGSNTLRSVFSQLTDSTNFANTNVGLLADVSKTGATSSGTVNTYGIWAESDASTTDGGSTATFNTYAVRADVYGDTDGTSTAYGLYASASGADTNWAAYLYGNVMIASPATNDDPNYAVSQARVATTDNTTTTLQTIPIGASNTYLIETRVVARRTGGTSGTAEDGATYVIRGTYKTVSGTVTLIGSVTTDYSVEDQSIWNATLTISGTTVLVSVSGANNNNVTWHATTIVSNVGS